MPRFTLSRVLELSEQVAHDVALPQLQRVDEEGQWPEEALRALQSAGLGGLVLSEEVGGLGHGLLALARVCENLGRVCASTALCFGMHQVGAAVLGAKATDAQKKQFLEPIAAGKHLTTLALSEPGTGSHFYLPQTRLTASGDGFRIDGQKSFVTNGGRADSYVVSTAAAGPNARPGDFSCVVVPADAAGLSWSGEWAGIGMRGNSARSATLDDVQLPRSHLLGSEGDEIWYVFNVVAPYFLMAMSGTYLGISQSALHETLAHLKERTYALTGSTLADQTVVQHRAGKLWAIVDRTRLLVHEAATRGETGHPDALLALCSAKAEVADAAVEVVNEAMTLCGGRGYAHGGTLFRNLRDARAAHVMAPTTDLLRTWVGRALLGMPLLGE